MIGYQVDEFTHTWSAQWFVAHSHIYPGLTDKVASPTHFPLEPGCGDFSFLDQAIANFEQGLDSILTDSIETPELDTCLDEPDAITSSVSSGFLHLVGTISDTSKLQLAPSIKFHKLWCQARALLALCLWLPRCQNLNCFTTSLATLLAFGFQSSTPPDNIALTATNRKADQSLSEFQIGIGATHAFLTWSSSLFTSELPLLILFLLYLILREELYLCLKCVNYLSRFMTFWTMLCLNELGTLLMF